MSEQFYIDNEGQIGSQPLTWDGEPLYSPSTVQEGLFASDAFEQMRGQQALETDYPKCPTCKHFDAHGWTEGECLCAEFDR